MKTLLLLLSLLPVHALADSCAERGFKVKGKAKEQVERYDSFVLSLKGKYSRKEIQAFVEKHGLPFNAEIKKGGVKGLDGWLEMEGMGGGRDAAVFLRKVKLDEKSGLGLDDVFLFSSGADKKPLHSWKVPFNNFYPAGLDGDEIIYHSSLYAFCRESDSVEIMIALKPDGSFRVIDWPKDMVLKDLPPGKCQAKKLFTKSNYATCVEIRDKKSQQKKVLVFEQPMN